MTYAATETALDQYIERDKLQYAWYDADIAWFTELQRVYGASAGTARYDNRGEATVELNALKQAYRECTAVLYAIVY